MVWASWLVLQKPSTAFRNPNHLRHFVLMQLFYLSFLNPLFHLVQPLTQLLRSTIWTEMITGDIQKLCRN